MPDRLQDEALVNDREAFAERLADTFDLIGVLQMLRAMGMRYSDLALALDVHPRTVRAWFEGPDRSPDRQRDAILSLKAVVLFLLRRGVLAPPQLTLWLMEPNESLEFRRPLAVLAEGRLDEVLRASTLFTKPASARNEVHPDPGRDRPAVPPGARALHGGDGASS